MIRLGMFSEKEAKVDKEVRSAVEQESRACVSHSLTNISLGGALIGLRSLAVTTP